MMDCAEYRRAVLADPNGHDPERARHLEGCAECPSFTQRLLRFEGKLARAVRVGPKSDQAEPGAPAARPVVAAGGRVVPLRRPRVLRVNRWLAVAASVLLGLGVAGGLWLAVPHASLAADVVAHMAGEPQAWVRTDVPVPAAALDSVLRDTHVRLRPDAGMVSYAQSCSFRGHRVPHLVVQTGMGPVTVMILAHETVAGPRSFDEQGYRGVIVPVPGHGSLAVLAQAHSADLAGVEKVASRVEGAIEWTG